MPALKGLMTMLSGLKEHRISAVLILLGVFSVTYSTKELIKTFLPLIEGGSSIRQEIRAEVIAAENRSKEYADGKHSDVLRAIDRLDRNIDGLHKRLDGVFLPKRAAVFIEKKEVNN